MSLLSRLFRKAPPPAPASAPPPARPKPSTEDRALAAAAEEQALQSAIESHDTQAVARLVLEGTSTKLRQAAAQAIEDPDLLQHLLRDVRGGNDKGVYKILASKRDVLHEQTRKQEQLQAEIQAASADLERHSQKPYDALYGPALHLYERQWEALAAQADAELRGRVQQWMEIARETVAEQLRKQADRAAHEQAAVHAAAEAQRQRQEQREASAAAAAEQARLLEEQQRALAEQQQTEQKAVRQIGGLIRKAHEALRDGSSSQAAGVRRAIEEKRVAAPPLPPHLNSQIQQLDQQLGELKDWKSFSVTPKRAELIETMESLVGVALDPLPLADQIKALQDEWRSLSKGAGENIEADWQRFHAAAQKAYQPCSDYFAAQARIREENLRRREALIAKLAAFESAHDWQQPDWRAVIKILRDTKLEWRSHSPVERQAGKQQEKGFEAISAKLQGLLDAEYTRNQAQKKALIERAQALLTSDEARKAIDGVKDLQQKWQAVGPVPREMDQRLWAEFRQHCDAVFQKRQQESAAYAAGLENHKTQALALCEQLDQMARLEGPELLTAAKTLGGLRKAFEALGEFPRAESRELQKKFDRAVERCEAALARQQVRDAEQSWSDLFEAANQVRAYQLAVARGMDAEPLDRLKKAVEAHLAAVPRWPKRGLDALKQALARAPNIDLAANEAALKLLCLRAEILSDTPTPPEDQTLRREYQLQRLVKSMGQGAKSDEASLDSLAIEWVGIGPIEEANYQALLQRFRHCRS